ncbi:phage holin family protein [Candidatus Saccharibacteria bacterium]|nr:phage holin family protein [Candidatus Saccharibacteria bacterium]
MIKRQLLGFAVRWVLSSFGMWIAITLFGTITGAYDAWLFIAAGLIFSLVNALVRPFATTMALPLIVLTMGIFTIIINTAMVALTIYLLPNVTMSFLGAVASSIIMSIINGLVNFWITPYNRK